MELNHPAVGFIPEKKPHDINLIKCDLETDVSCELEHFWIKVKEETLSAHEEDEAVRGVADQQAGWHSGHVLCTLKTAAEKNSHGIAKSTL